MYKEKLKLYLVTDRRMLAGGTLTDVVAAAVQGGVTMVQLREKDIDTGEFVLLARQLKEMLTPLCVPLIINDRVDVALAVDADGVHIGQKDMPYSVARRLLGRGKIIGLSIETMAELEEANRLDVDYVAASPVFATPTKTDTAKPWGLEGLREFCAKSVHPVVGIGGMNKDTVPDVMRAGVSGVAVVSAILSSANPKKAAGELKKLVSGGCI